MTVATEPLPLWDGATRCFDGGRLHAAILNRGWSVEEFAQVCRPALHANTVLRAIRGGVCRDKTVLSIYDALASRRPQAIEAG